MEHLESIRGEWVDPNGEKWAVDMLFVVLNGRAECVGLGIRSITPTEQGRWRPVDGEVRPIRAETLRSFTMSVVEEARAQFAAVLGDKGALSPGLDDRERERLRTAFTASHRSKLVDADGKPVPTRDALAEVARIYGAAWRRGDSPTKAVAEAFKISKSAAAKRVARARAAGLLPPTEQGRARGGAPSTRSTAK